MNPYICENIMLRRNIFESYDMIIYEICIIICIRLLIDVIYNTYP